MNGVVYQYNPVFIIVIASNVKRARREKVKVRFTSHVYRYRLTIPQPAL